MLFLGTGAADIEAPTRCHCPNCAAVRHAGGRSRRTHSSLLLDAHTLVDCGATVPGQLARYRRSLPAIRHLLLTHLHEDHADPQAVAHLVETATAGGRSLTLVGGREAVSSLRALLPAVARVLLRPLRPFVTAPVGDWQVTALPARHMDNHPEAFLYLLDSPEYTLFYACDTGPLPTPTRNHLRSSPVDCVVMEATFGFQDEQAGIADLASNHLNFPLAVAERDRLLGEGVLTSDTPWYATHLSLHHCPPHEEAERWLAQRGIRLAWDGLEVDMCSRSSAGHPRDR